MQLSNQTNRFIGHRLYLTARLFAIIAVFLLAACQQPIAQSVSDEYPPIYPDYIDKTVPPNIAPLNFGIIDANHLHIQAYLHDKLLFEHRTTDKTDLNIDSWHDALNAAINDTIKIHVASWTSEQPEGLRYKPFDIRVVADKIDDFITYRLIPPGYILWNKMGLYQRNLTNFDERCIMSNEWNHKGCVNCHSFHQYSAKKFMFHARGKNGGTILIDGDNISRIDFTKKEPGWKGTYPYWHPSGRYIAMSNNNTHQSFYGNSADKVEVYDLQSDLMIYDLANDKVIVDNRFADDQKWETFPAFSPDGERLYFCQAKPATMPVGVDSLHYSLLSIDFDAHTGKLGNAIDTLFNANADGSASFPRISPDGKYLIYTKSDCGTFPIWHKEADLHIINLANNHDRNLSELNSDETDSYHSFSSNSRWLIFSSRRLDGRHTRLFIAYLNPSGIFEKPFLLPQNTPDFDDYRLYSYNIPEFVAEQIDIDPNALKELFR